MRRSVPAFMLLAALAAAADSALPAARPNVLLIAVDDLNHWVGYIGRNAQTKTPNIDRLAARGVCFTRAYCAAPVCNPSRAALMSGMRPSATGVYRNADDWRLAIPEAATVLSTFRAAGYRVAGAGKIYHGGFERRGEWDDYFKPPPRVAPPKASARGASGIRFGPLDCRDDQLPDYGIADAIIAQLGKKHEKPFFLACGLHLPHMPWFVPRTYFDLFPIDRIEIPPHVEKDLADIPAFGVRLAGPRGDHAAIVKAGLWKEAVQAYLAAIAYTDMNVGRLLDALDRSPHRDTTIVCFFGDNGFHLGEKEHWRKFALWEESARVPFIWVAPGVTRPGGVCARPVDFMGIYPTLTELCGIRTPAHVQSASLRPLLADPAASWDRPAITTYLPGNHAVRLENWCFIRYRDGGEELYDIARDPFERTNLAGDPRLASKKGELARYLPTADTPPVKGAAGGGLKGKAAGRRAKEG